MNDLVARPLVPPPGRGQVMFVSDLGSEPLLQELCAGGGSCRSRLVAGVSDLGSEPLLQELCAGGGSCRSRLEAA
jgi:hypothetical protein